MYVSMYVYIYIYLCVCVNVWLELCHQKSFSFVQSCRGPPGPRGAVVNEDHPGKLVQTYLPFFQIVWQPGSAEELDTVII